MRRNSEIYPECWDFFIKHARNISGEEEAKIGKYRVPKPDMSGKFIYHDRVEMLFQLLKDEFYKINPKSPSVYGRIQYIVQNFK
jgi:hypothetical protein